MKTLARQQQSLDRFVVVTGAAPAEYTASILEGVIDLNHAHPTGYEAKDLCAMIVSTANRKDLKRLFLACHDGADGPCVGWVVVQPWEDPMGGRLLDIGPVWVRRGLRAEPLAAMAPHVHKLKEALKCGGLRTESIRLDKRNKLVTSIDAYAAWAEPFGLHVDAVVFRGK